MKKKECPFCKKIISHKQPKRCPHCGKYIYKHYKTLAELERNKEIISILDKVKDLKEKYKLSRQAVNAIYRREKHYEE